MMVTFEQRVSTFRSEAKRFQEYLKGLPEDAWDKQSACDEWKVADVVAHLVGNSEFYARTVTQGLQGNSSPPEGRPEAGTGHPSISSASLAKSSIEARERLGDQLLATFIEKDDALGDILSGLSPEDQAKPCYHPGSIVPAGNFVDLRFKEIVLHEWDIRSGIEDQVTLSPNSLESIVTLICESFASGSVRWAFWAGKPLEKPVRYRFEVKEPVLITAGILVRGDAFRLELSALGPADVTFRCDTNTFALMMYGRMPVQAAVESGQLEVEGDAQLAARFGQWFKGI
ncbi:MAG: hypothetical protein CL759_07660 [Chloroflexi bacterium]|nr:hypothetical protein [Chloroflexota bacterium]